MISQKIDSATIKFISIEAKTTHATCRNSIEMIIRTFKFTGVYKSEMQWKEIKIELEWSLDEAVLCSQKTMQQFEMVFVILRYCRNLLGKDNWKYLQVILHYSCWHFTAMKVYLDLQRVQPAMTVRQQFKWFRNLKMFWGTLLIVRTWFYVLA